METIPNPDNKSLDVMKDPQVELLQWHYHLNHLIFGDLQMLSKLGVFPKWSPTVLHPKCVACIFGTTHRRQWQMQARVSNIHILLIISSDHFILINQIISLEPGFTL